MECGWRVFRDDPPINVLLPSSPSRLIKQGVDESSKTLVTVLSLNEGRKCKLILNRDINGNGAVVGEERYHY